MTILIGFALLVIFQITGRSTTPELDWKAGATWTLPWLGGLCLVSYLGDYGGGRGVIGFGWGFLVLAALSAIIYALAIAVRLPRERVDAHIAEAVSESELEQDELGTSPA